MIQEDSPMGPQLSADFQGELSTLWNTPWPTTVVGFRILRSLLLFCLVVRKRLLHFGILLRTWIGAGKKSYRRDKYKPLSNLFNQNVAYSSDNLDPAGFSHSPQQRMRRNENGIDWYTSHFHNCRGLEVRLGDMICVLDCCHNYPNRINTFTAVDTLPYSIVFPVIRKSGGL